MAKNTDSKPTSQPSVNVESWLLSECLTRIAGSFERIADAVEHLVKIECDRFDREYPTKTIRPATIVTAKYPNPKLDQPELAGTKDELFEGVIGPREKALREKLQRSKTRGSKTPRA